MHQIELLLRKNGKNLSDFASIPSPIEVEERDLSNHLIIQELSYDKASLAQKSEALLRMLNADKKEAFTAIMNSLTNKLINFFFIYGSGGTGLLFLWNFLACSLRAKGEIVLTIASSGIAATLLPGGRIAHSRFAIPIHVAETSICGIWQNSPLAVLVKVTSLIIWDEAPMVQRFCIKAFNRSLQDIMQNIKPFGGKFVVFGGDFRQILPVLPRESRANIVDACMNSSPLWKYCTIYRLNQNMRLIPSNDPIVNKKISDFWSGY